MNLALLVHSIASIRFGTGIEGAYDWAPRAQCTNYNDDDDAYDILVSLGILTPRVTQSCSEFIEYDFTAVRPGLQEYLADFPPPASMERAIVGCFLRMASKPVFEERFEPDAARLPVEREASPVPGRFMAEARALEGGGYCEIDEGYLLWTDRAIAIFHDKGVWIDGQPAIRKEIAELTEIWLNMPDEIRRHSVLGGAVNPLMLADAMRHYWSKDIGWHDGSARPGHSTPSAIDRLRSESEAMDVASRLASMVNPSLSRGRETATLGDRLDLLKVRYGRQFAAVFFIILIMLMLGGAVWAALHDPAQTHSADWMIQEQKKLRVAAVTLALCAAASIWAVWNPIADILGFGRTDRDG